VGFARYEGTISLDERAVIPGDPRDWLAWAGQRPGLFAGTIASNVTLGELSVERNAAALSLALDWAGAGDLDPLTVLGVGGEGLSGGQAQRVAVARAIYRARARACHVVIADEPSSALDAVAEAALISGLRRLTAEGRIVIVVSHRPAFIGSADQVVQLRETNRV
jgi:ATP-binding cassette subfamily C protein CydD